jgi:hypothetical protein
MTISLVIAFIRGWMLTLLCLSTFPLMIVAQYFQMQYIAGLGGESNKALAPPPIIVPLPLPLTIPPSRASSTILPYSLRSQSLPPL